MKILDIMGDNIATAGREAGSGTHVVVRVGQEWSPEKVDLLQVRLTCEVAG